MSLDLLQDLINSAPAADPQALIVANRNAQRSAATRAGRERKREHHKQVLASVDGDREKLKTISVWVPRKVKSTLFARAQDKIAWHAKGDAHRFLDMQIEVEDTEYDLEQIEVERARPPKEEVEFAKLQGRFREQTASINGFFAPKQVVKTHRRPTDYYAPLGDFEWCERDEAVTTANRINHANAKARAARPITKPG